jgi:hypothetical protein
LPLPDLLSIGVLVFVIAFSVMTVILCLRLKTIKEPRKLIEKITKIFAFAVALALSSFLGVSGIFYGLYLQPYPGETIGTTLRAAFIFGSGALVWFTLSSVMEQMERFFESSQKERKMRSEVQIKEKQDFRNSVATEMHTILKMFAEGAVHFDIAFPNWSSRVEQSKIAILGKTDYALLKQFYDRIEERNKYLISTRAVLNWPELESLNRKCIEALSQAFTGISWVKELVPDMDSVLSQVSMTWGSRKKSESGN